VSAPVLRWAGSPLDLDWRLLPDGDHSAGEMVTARCGVSLPIPTIQGDQPPSVRLCSRCWTLAGRRRIRRRATVHPSSKEKIPAGRRLSSCLDTPSLLAAGRFHLPHVVVGERARRSNSSICSARSRSPRQGRPVLVRPWVVVAFLVRA
jgi:hypothetical protein